MKSIQNHHLPSGKQEYLLPYQETVEWFLSKGCEITELIFHSLALKNNCVVQ